MDSEWTESRYERSQERYDDDSPTDNVQLDSQKSRESSKHRSKDGRKSRREERDLNSKDKDLSKASDDIKEADKETKGPGKDRVSSREKRKDEKEEHPKHRGKGKSTEKDHDRDKNRERDHIRDSDKRERRKEREHDGENDTEKEFEWGQEERGKERNRDREKGREREKRDRMKDKPKEMERERHSDRDKEREYERDEKEKGREKPRGRERDFDEDKDKLRDREKTSKRNRDDGYDRNKDLPKEGRDFRENDAVKGIGSPSEEESGMIVEQEEHLESALDSKNQSVSELKERILKRKEERLQGKSEGSEILSWVSKLGKFEERKREEKKKALLRSKMFEEQDKIVEDDDDDQTVDGLNAGGLAGVKVLHGLDKVMEGGSVVLTLKDQHILAGGDINEELDMLENVEIGEQKQRDEAYKAAKKKPGIYEDKFNEQADSVKKILPQYDDPMIEEGVTLDASGRFSGEAEKKLEELRRRLKGPSVKSQVDDLNSSVKVTSDYYTPEEMLQFKKPKKKKSLRKKEKFDIDALEAEAIAAGLGVADLGSRNDPSRQAAKEEQERSEAEKRNSAYQTAKAKADEASRALRTELAPAKPKEDVDVENFADDADDYQKCLDRVRKIALTKQKEGQASGPEAIALIAASKSNNKPTDDLKPVEPSENKVVITEMEEFVQGLHFEEEVTKPGDEDFFMEEDEAPKAFKEEDREDTGGYADIEDSAKQVVLENDDQDDIVPDETIHEAPVGKGVAGALKLLKERGALKETVEWGGRNMDKKKSKLVGIYDGGEKEIRIERTDEYGRILTPKEAFRLLSHKFHGKGPGKMKQEKRQKQYQDELKLKQMKNSDTPSESVDRMREAQARLKTPYLMLSGHVKPGQTSHPTSGFATVEKDFPGSLTPMLGDKKVEHFLGIKRKAETPNSGIPKKAKP